MALAPALASARASAQVLPPLDSEPVPPAKPVPVAPPGRTSIMGWFDLSLAGTRTETADGRTAGSALGSLDLAFVSNSRNLDERLELGGALGGGSAGFEGQGRADVLMGLRLYVRDEQGPFARFGFTSRIVGNQLFELSYFAWTAEAGYQYIDSHVGLDVGLLAATTGSTPALGAFATLGAGRAFLRLEWERFFRSGGSLDIASNRGCLRLDSIIAACLATWSLSDSTRAVVSYAGLSVGLGGGFTAMTAEAKQAPAGR